MIQVKRGADYFNWAESVSYNKANAEPYPEEHGSYRRRSSHSQVKEDVFPKNRDTKCVNARVKKIRCKSHN